MAGRLVPPAAGVFGAFLGRFCASDDQLDRAGQGRAAPGSASSGSAVMPTTSASINVLMPWQYIGPWLELETSSAVGVLMGQDVADALVDRLAIGSGLARDVAGGEERHHRQRRDRGRRAEPARFPRPVGLLRRLQMLERPVDRRVLGWRGRPRLCLGPNIIRRHAVRQSQDRGHRQC